MVITSTSNPRLKSAMELRERRAREREGLVLVEGVRETERALAGGFVPREVWAREGDLRPEIAALCDACRAAGATSYRASTQAFERLAMRDGDAGIVSIFEISTRSLVGGDAGAALILAAHGVEKPGNLGALLRTADGCGATGVIALEGSVDLFAPQVIRASLGTVFTQPVVAMSSEELVSYARREGVALVAAALSEQSRAPWEIDLRRPVCLVLGSEAHGLPREWLEASELVQIPMRGHADSLNVSAAGAMLLYEALRQRASS